MGERANLLTSHLQAMGLRDFARITSVKCMFLQLKIEFNNRHNRSWHLSITLAYLPAWIIVAIVWHFRIFTGTHILIVLLVQFTLWVRV